ncbi:hypothetical protein EC5411_24626, partial [Escherichia coli 541-1]
VVTILAKLMAAWDTIAEDFITAGVRFKTTRDTIT